MTRLATLTSSMLNTRATLDLLVLLLPTCADCSTRTRTDGREQPEGARQARGRAPHTCGIAVPVP